jgi:hypothetical protein
MFSRLLGWGYRKQWTHRNRLALAPTPSADAEAAKHAAAKQPPSGIRIRAEVAVEELDWIPAVAGQYSDCPRCFEPIQRGERCYKIRPKSPAPVKLRNRLLCRWCGEELARMAGKSTD